MLRGNPSRKGESRTLPGGCDIQCRGADDTLRLQCFGVDLPPQVWRFRGRVWSSHSPEQAARFVSSPTRSARFCIRRTRQNPGPLRLRRLRSRGVPTHRLKAAFSGDGACAHTGSLPASDQPTCMAGRRSRSGSALRRISCVSGAISPSPNRMKRARYRIGLPSVQPK